MRDIIISLLLCMISAMAGVGCLYVGQLTETVGVLCPTNR